MNRDLSLKEKDLLNRKVPKALGKGRKSDDTKVKANKILVDAGYKEYFNVEEDDHNVKKRKWVDTSKAPSIFSPPKAASSSGRGVTKIFGKVNNIFYKKLYMFII